jgi:hypothetical protein
MDKPLLTNANQTGARPRPRFFSSTVLFVLVGIGALTASQSESASPPQAPQSADGYVGIETCRTCHEGSFNSWKSTAMGKAFLDRPRSQLESRGCESCHGPGRAHVEGGGNLNSIIRFAKNENRPAEELNAACLQCHEKSGRLFWQGSTHESRGVPSRSTIGRTK